MELPVADSYRYQDVSKLVKDVIENEQVPSVLWAKTCWPKIDDFNFVRSFEIPMQIVKSNSPINLMLNGITNKLWFFIDMNCEASFDFLMNTQDTYFTHPYRWIIVDASNDSIENLAFLPGSNVILANQQLNSAKYELRQGLFSFHYFIISLYILIIKVNRSLLFSYFVSLQNWQRRSIDL